jgi:prephenate dehydrogenase
MYKLSKYWRKSNVPVSTFGIIGYGQFGAFVAELLARFVPEAPVYIYSQRHAADGQKFYTLTEAAACDVVILCCAISEHERTLLEVLPHLRPDSILVDVATVKKYPTEIFQKYAPDRRWVSCHPMFGPESYKKTNGDVSGYRIVVTDYTLVNDSYFKVKNFFSRLGFIVIEMSPDEHDQLLAETLFLTHYIGQTVSAAGFKRTNIDTVSFNSLMNAVEIVMKDKRLFTDVYRFNPYCKEVAKRFHDAQEKVFTDLHIT